MLFLDDFFKMTPYEIIVQDLNTEEQTQLTMQTVPYLEEMNMTLKMKVTYECLLRAQKLKHRISALIFAFFLGQLIERREIAKKDIRTFISEHYYIISVRTYYIFEVNPVQIYNTKLTSLTLIRKLKQEDFTKLTIQF